MHIVFNKNTSSKEVYSILLKVEEHYMKDN